MTLMVFRIIKISQGAIDSNNSRVIWVCVLHTVYPYCITLIYNMHKIKTWVRIFLCGVLFI